MDYLELHIKQDRNDCIDHQVYKERLTILKEFLTYLEEKKILILVDFYHSRLLIYLVMI